MTSLLMIRASFASIPLLCSVRALRFLIFNLYAILVTQAVRLMRQKLKMSSTVIIGCTGNADEAAREMFQAGADNVWGKPMPHTREMISDIAAARVARLGDGAAKLPGCKKLLIVDDSKVRLF